MNDKILNLIYKKSPFTATLFSLNESKELSDTDVFTLMSYAIGNVATMRSLNTPYIQESTLQFPEIMDHTFVINALHLFKEELEEFIMENIETYVSDRIEVTEQNIKEFTETATYQFMNYISDAVAKNKINVIAESLLMNEMGE